MKADSLILKTKSLISKLMEYGFTEELAKSILIKMYLVVKFKLVEETCIKEKKIRLRNILESNKIPFITICQELEIYQTLSEEIDSEILENLQLNFSHLSDKEFFNNISELGHQKREGQYFTDKRIVNQIFENLFRDKEKDKVVTTVDFAAGLGDFLQPLLREKNFENYGVELDPLSYEFLILNILWNPKIEMQQKAKAILMIKNGDSLLGFQSNAIDEIRTSTEGKELLNQYRSKRIEILKKKQISEEEIFEVITIRKRLEHRNSKFTSFNWFIDFPEIFIDGSTKILKNAGFDFVVGNPPWLEYAALELRKYDEIFSTVMFSDFLKGKFNFSLPFLILANYLSVNKTGLVIPQGIISETYAANWRKSIFKEKTLYELVLCDSEWFEHVQNEFCLIFLNKKEKTDRILIKIQSNNQQFMVDYSSLKPPLYKISLVPTELYAELDTIFRNSNEISNYCEIRRGLTLTKKYQEHYSDEESKSKNIPEIKKLIRHNRINETNREGVTNYQVFYNGEKLVYDRQLLGAPGTPQLFEQPKIIRRNRGRKWMIGLDTYGDFYVNDIFDMIIPNLEKISLNALFGYLTSSLIQFLSESYLQRDITSNTVRQLPYLDLETQHVESIDKFVTEWQNSGKKKDDTLLLREKVDEIIFNRIDIPKRIIKQIKEKAVLHWV